MYQFQTYARSDRSRSVALCHCYDVDVSMPVPSIPWHRLPQAPALLAPQLAALAPGYIAQHRSVLAGQPIATPQA